MCILEEDNNSFIVDIKRYLNTLKGNWGIKELYIDLEGTRIS